ncbi:MAG: SemiSWEET family transporter [Devosiaceae bacterium]|nr:SemiSWEET family transporter [Devosiaceae bacterium]
MPELFVETIGMIAAILGTICWLPQVIKLTRTKDTKSLSLWTNILLLVTVSLWLIYGLMLGSLPLIIANVASVTLIGIIVIYKIKYG